MAAIALISFLGLVICLVMIIVSAIKNNGQVKKWAIGLVQEG